MLYTSRRTYANMDTQMHGGVLTGNTVIVITGIIIRTPLPQEVGRQGHL